MKESLSIEDFIPDDSEPSSVKKRRLFVDSSVSEYSFPPEMRHVRTSERKVRDEIKRGNQRMVIAIAGASLLMSAFIVFGLDGFTPSMALGVPVISWMLGGVGAFFLLFALQD